MALPSQLERDFLLALGQFYRDCAFKKPERHILEGDYTTLFNTAQNYKNGLVKLPISDADKGFAKTAITIETDVEIVLIRAAANAASLGIDIWSHANSVGKAYEKNRKLEP